MKKFCVTLTVFLTVLSGVCSAKTIGDKGDVELEIGENVYMKYFSYGKGSTSYLNEKVLDIYEEKGNVDYVFSNKMEFNYGAKSAYSQDPDLCYVSESEGLKVCIGDKAVVYGQIGEIIGIQVRPSGLFSKKRRVLVETENGYYYFKKISSIGISKR
ncbi:hypothetical protein HBN50_02865 [Halobacteriovorax sp. GB3]|uniref:hypothetical protein n=1 Tax=Halobacteriovorax sp. GB3 TaxID=2719615 RepID=UPI0023620654|nr:hypothetical protein [Halobacteriovorax sp. GB3]MDD0852016.1 hypothetical protein [Halobacteriovorax sp. GB3]